MSFKLSNLAKAEKSIDVRENETHLAEILRLIGDPPFPEPTFLLVSTKTWSSGISNREFKQIVTAGIWHSFSLRNYLLVLGGRIRAIVL